MKKTILLFLLVGLFFSTKAETADSSASPSLFEKITPNSLNFQYAGNIGMFSIGARYDSGNKKWQGSLHYGFVPSSFADKPIHATTLKVNYIPIRRQLSEDTQMDWLKIGMWSNYAYGRKYFRKLPDYYDSGYYYFPTAVNIGLTFGSEIRHKKWGLYYEAGTTDKTVINFAKSPKSVDFYELFSLGIGVSYHLK